MSDNCITSTRPVTSRQQAIQCDVCLQWNHRTCNTGKLPFILHFHSVCKTPLIFEVMSDILLQEIVPQRLTFSFLQEFLNKVIEPLYVQLPAQIGFAQPVSFLSPVAESSRISMTELSAEILESSHCNFQGVIITPLVGLI